MNNNFERGEFLEKELLESIREKFYYVNQVPNGKKRIFLDSASGSLKLKEMVNVVSRESGSYAQYNRIDLASEHAGKLVEETRNNLRVFTGANNGIFYFGLSATQTLFYMSDVIISSVKKDSNIVTSKLDHPGIYDSAFLFSEKYGIERRVVNFDTNKGHVPPEDLLQKVDSKTSLLAIIHASNITGGINDLHEIIHEARKINPSIYVLIDGVQFAPHLALDLDKLNPDVYVFSGYKMFCKKGLSLGYLSERMSILPHWKLRGTKENEWVLGTLDEATLASFSTTIDYIAEIGKIFTNSKNKRCQVLAGMEKIHSHSNALLELLLFGDAESTGLFNMDHVCLYGLDRNDLRARTPLASFRIKGISNNEALKKYYEKSISICIKSDDAFSKHIVNELGVSGLLRVSMCHYNTAAEIREFLDVTGNIV